MLKNNFLPIDSLLPLRMLVVSLRFLQPSTPRFFHQAAINAFIRYLLDQPSDFDRLLIIDTPESGRVNYREGDYYRFCVVGLAGSDSLLKLLIQRLRQLPMSATHTDLPLAFRDNWRLQTLHDAFTENPVENLDELSLYGGDALCEEARVWSQQKDFYWHWLSPVRLLKAKDRRGKVKGELRFCRGAGDIDADLLLSRVYDTSADLLRRRGATTPPRPRPPPLSLLDQHLFWLDSEYSDREGREQVMGGMLGYFGWQTAEIIDDCWWQLLVLGQYLGVGQRRCFGWGRYELVTAQGGVTYRRGLPAFPLLTQVVAEENLLRAYRHIADNASQRQRREEAEAYFDAPKPLLAGDYGDEAQWANTLTLADSETDTALEQSITSDDLALERLHKLAQQLLNQKYTVPVLRGHLIPKADGSTRALAVPPFWDRVLQRAAAQVLTPALEEIMYGRSYGYRPGRSRITAKNAIQRAWREGYCWVFESDIEDFFTSVNLRRLQDRLRALFYDDPLVEQIIAWLAAPVEYEGERFERSGLPQGSPLSPLMANLLLDDFDSDMQTAGFRLIRFADDFLVMCKSPEEAERAREQAQASLAEHGLTLKLEKTRRRQTAEGFKYLGYLFVNDMALDVGGGGDISVAGALRNDAWLQHLGRRSPKKIASESELVSPWQTSKQNPHQLRVGERDEQGTFLCVTGEVAVLSTQSGRLRVERDEQRLADLPWQGLQAVLLAGPHHITTPALRAALANDVPIHFASSQGYYQGVAWNGQPGSAGYGLWLLQQQRAGDPQAALYIARQLTLARLEQQAETLRQRNLPQYAQLKEQCKAVARVETLSMLNGVEGSAARIYFAALAECLPEAWGFNGRKRRPPPDPFNVLLSLGYSVLFAYAESILRVDGLLPWQGFYHQSHGRHAALASDLMEPFRHVVERVALTQVSRGSLKPEDFTLSQQKGCRMKDSARRRYLATLQQRFDTQTQSKGSEQKEKLYQQLHRQNLSLIGWLQGDSPFEVWKNR